MQDYKFLFLESLFLNCHFYEFAVELGRRYFPNCSLVLDKFMEDDLPDLFYLEKGTSEEQKIKRKRFKELKDDVQRAFNKDKAENRCSGLSSSSSCNSLKDHMSYKFRKMWKYIVDPLSQVHSFEWRICCPQNSHVKVKC